MAHGHSLPPTRCLYAYIISKTNEISSTTHPLGITYNEVTYHITLWYLFSSPCQNWWWPSDKGPKHVAFLLTPYTLINCVVFWLIHLINWDVVIAHNGDEPPKRQFCLNSTSKWTFSKLPCKYWNRICKQAPTASLKMQPFQAIIHTHAHIWCSITMQYQHHRSVDPPQIRTQTEDWCTSKCFACGK